MRRPEQRPGKLIVVGCGLQPSRHVSQRTISEIRRAEVVFVLADPFAIDWVRSLNGQVENLSEHYEDHRDRRASYRDMERALLGAVRAGSRVCAVFYGHPGVFAQVSGNAIRQARDEGFEARMEPGISAEACLYADLGMDPGRRGVQSIEATRFLAFEHRLDPCSLVLLWQVALAGSLDCRGFSARPDRLQLLVDKLDQYYPPDTEGILYEAAQLPITDFRAERLPLAELPGAGLHAHTTLVIPPALEASRDEHWIQALAALD